MKLLIVSLFVISLISGFIKSSSYLNLTGDESGFLKVLNPNENSFFRSAIILLIPLGGIFINKRIGWILIQSYFYFLITHLAFKANYLDLTNIILIVINSVGFLLLLLIIVIMNKRKISRSIYRIPKTDLITMNIIASIIGMSLTIILVKI